jgi:hypothetical protein
MRSNWRRPVARKAMTPTNSSGLRLPNPPGPPRSSHALCARASLIFTCQRLSGRDARKQSFPDRPHAVGAAAP